MNRPAPLLPAARLAARSLLVLAACLLGPPASDAAPLARSAMTAPARKADAPLKAAKPAKPATPRQQRQREASALALASSTAEAINAAQLNMAARVLTGHADCEFNQRISVQPVDGQPGYFTVTHKDQRYRMLPQETSTGAVRLEDKAAGMVWLQIPSKSMLMNARIGQRLVDSCLHAEQRAGLLAVVDVDARAANSLGIVAPLAALPAELANQPPGDLPSGLPDIAPGVLPPAPAAALVAAAPWFDTATAPTAPAAAAPTAAQSTPGSQNSAGQVL